MSGQGSQNLSTIENDNNADPSPMSPVQPLESPTNSTEETLQTQDEEQSSSSSSQPSRPKTCDNCSKPPPSESKPLKPCTKCQTVFYCNRDCQKAHFKVHKKVCAAAAQEYAMNANLKLDSKRAPPPDGRRGGLQKWQFDT